MPFTPFHIGPALLVSLILYPMLDIPTFLISNIILDLEPLYIILTGSSAPLHGIFHSLSVGIVPALIVTSIIHFSRKYTRLIGVNHYFTKDSNFRSILVTSIAGIWLHVVIDALLYIDLKILYPLDWNPLLGLANEAQLIELSIYSYGLSVIVYVIRVTFLFRRKSAMKQNDTIERFEEVQIFETPFEQLADKTTINEPPEMKIYENRDNAESHFIFTVRHKEDEVDPDLVVPKHTSKPDIFLGSEGVPVQWGIIGRSGGETVAVDLNDPHIVFVSGKQGSGKGYTIGVLSEMLLTVSISNISQVSKPATIIVFHKPREDSRSEFWSIVRENTNPKEVLGLSDYGVEPQRIVEQGKLRVFIDPFVYENEMKKFEEDYETSAYPIGINPSNLTSEDWPHVLSIGKKSGSIYVKKIFQIIKKKQYDDDFGLHSIRREIELSDLNPNQKGFAYMRLETLQDYLEAGDFTNDILIGGVNIFDLRKIMMEPDDIFSVMILVISAILNKEQYSKEQFVFVINEAHNYLRRGLSKEFTDYINYLIRKKRHAGTWLMLDTHFPEDVDRKIIKGSDIKIFHKSDILSSNILNQIVGGIETEPHKLETGQAIIRADNSTRGPDILLATNIRPRLTHHGGVTKTAV